MERRQFFRKSGLFLSGGLTIGIPTAWFFHGLGYNQGEDDGHQDGYEDGVDRGIDRAGGIEPTSQDDEYRSLETTLTIDPESHRELGFGFDLDTYLVYSFAATDHIDAVFVDRENFEAYRSDGDVHFDRRLTRQDTTEGLVREVVPPGDYNLVLDNTTRWGKATSDGPVDVSVNMRAYQRMDDES